VVSLEITQLRASIEQTQQSARQTKIQADAMGQPMNPKRVPWDLSTKATQEDIDRLKRTHATTPDGGPCNPEIAPFPPTLRGERDNPEKRCQATSWNFNTFYIPGYSD